MNVQVHTRLDTDRQMEILHTKALTEDEICKFPDALGLDFFLSLSSSNSCKIMQEN